MEEYFLQHDGKILLITLFGLVTVLPIGIVLSFKRKYRYIGWLCILLFLPFGLILGHELWLHESGRRPLSSVYEIVFNSFVPSPKKDLSLKLPFKTAHYEFDTVHSQTGKYAIYLWTPITLPLHTRSKTDLRIKVRFVDPAGNVVFEQLDFNYPLVWYPSSDRMGWSRAFCFLYRAPSDVPFDIPLKCVIDFNGDVEDFIRNYPNSELTLNRVIDW